MFGISVVGLKNIQLEGVLHDEATSTGVIEGDDTTLILNCLLCGKESANGYKFADGAFGTVQDNRVKELYENVPVFLNHGDRKRHPLDREVEGLAGKIINARLDDQGRPRGDIETAYGIRGDYLRKLVRGGFKRIGLSHTGTYRRGGKGRENVIERIEDVFSVDAVLSPATTRSFHESTNTQEQEEMEEKIKELEIKLAAAVERAEKAEKSLVTFSAESAAEIDKLKKENSELLAENTAFKAEKAAAEAKAAVLAALKDAGIDAESLKPVVLETFCEAAEDRRKALIEAYAEGQQVKEGSKGEVQGAKERKGIKTESWDVKKALEGDIFE